MEGVEDEKSTILELQNIIEQDMILIGATAIKDTLQPEVGNTVNALN